MKCGRDNLSSFTAAYEPGAGTAANVLDEPDNDDKMLFYGNFGSGVQVIEHTISTVGNANISPSGLTTKVINGLDNNPNDEDDIWVTVNTDQDLLRTVNGGGAYSTKNAALGITPTALVVLSFPDKILIGGHNGTTQLLYSSDEGATFTDQAGATLGAVANIVSIGVVT